MPIEERASKQTDFYTLQAATASGLGQYRSAGFEYPDQPVPLAAVRCDAALGGLLNHYYTERMVA